MSFFIIKRPYLHVQFTLQAYCEVSRGKTTADANRSTINCNHLPVVAIQL